jgi:hypothetical protein
MGERTIEGLQLSRAERARAWVLAGPIGRLWSFVGDLGTLLVALIAHLIERGRARLRRQSSAA